MIKRLANSAYGRERGIEAVIDDRVPDSYIVGEVLTRFVQKARAAGRLYPDAYIAPNVRIRCRRQVQMGRSISLGRGVLINGLSANGILIGDNCTFDEYAVVKGSGVIRNLGVGVRIGHRTAIGTRNTILGQGGVRIGDDCLLGPNVTIVSENHNIAELERPIRAQGETRSEIFIGNDVWIGAGATILAGSTIGDGAVVAAGAVVRGAVEPFSIVGGIPARTIGRRGGHERA